MNQPKDWRGVEINIGDRVIYGSGVGRSIQLNEAQVIGFGKEPTRRGEYQKVKLHIIRRSYMTGVMENVQVGCDRMTVVSELPPTSLPTQAEKNEEDEARHQRFMSHTRQGNDRPYPDRSDYGSYNEWSEAFAEYQAKKRIDWSSPCIVCGCSREQMYQKECDTLHSII